MIPGKLNNTVFIRFVVTSPNTTSEDINNSIQEILKVADFILEQTKENQNTNNNNIIEENKSEKIKPKNEAEEISSYVKPSQTETCATFCAPRPKITQVARS